MATARPTIPGFVPSVEINLVNGKFSYTGAGNPVHVKQGDPIAWSCQMGNFAVHFDRIAGTPCPSVEYHGSPQQIAQAQIRGNAPDGRYKYVVAVADSTGTIYIDDPEVIVP